MNETTRTSIEAGVNTHYDKTFLIQMLYELRLAQFGQKRPLPDNEGDNVDFFKYNEIPLSLTGGVVDVKITDESSDTAITQITGRTINAAIDEYAGYSKHSKMVKLSHIDKNLAGVSELWGNFAARLYDFLCWQEVVANGATPVRADLDATAQLNTVVVDSGTTGAGDPAAASIWIPQEQSGFGNLADHLNQAIMVITSGKAKGTARPVLDYTVDAVNDVANCIIDAANGFEVLPEAGDSVTIVSPHGLVSGAAADMQNTAAIHRAVRVLRANGARPLEGGYFGGILTAGQEESLKNDSSWENLHTYKDSLGADGMFTGEIGKYAGVRWVRANQQFMFPIVPLGTAGTGGGPGTNGKNYRDDFSITAPETAIISVGMVLGKECFGVTQFASEQGGMKPRIIIKTPGPQTVSQPVNRWSTVGFWMAMVCKALNPMFGVQFWTAEAGI